MPRLKFDMWFPRKNTGVCFSFTDGKGRELETWFSSPPDSIDHACINYLKGRFPNVKNEKHCEFIKRKYKEEIPKFLKEDSQ